MSPRFSGGGSRLPAVEKEETITVGVRATLTLNLWVESTQSLKSVQVLITDSKTEGKTETLIGVDGVTGTPIQVAVTRP